MTDPSRWYAAPIGRLAQAEEQDRAAGGRELRRISRPDGQPALASISLRRFRGREGTYAYLRWRAAGIDHTEYVGVVRATTRPEALAQAWASVIKAR